MEANITWLTDNVATGGDLSMNADRASAQLLELLDMDIDLIIDCRLEDNDWEVWAMTDVEYLHLPTNDAAGHHIPASHFDRAVEAATRVIDGGGKVFAHCHMGINRGPSTAFAILLAQGMNPCAAFDLIREKRPMAAIYYADDALEAHHRRIGLGRGESNVERVKLRRHIRKVFGTEERRAVQHIIRTNHQRDRMERASSV